VNIFSDDLQSSHGEQSQAPQVVGVLLVLVLLVLLRLD
jgi:hypothetical protein